jgi:hypothetical protein
MDPISPELVLVDPELAHRARARLPDRRDRNGKVAPAVVESIGGAASGRPLVRAGLPSPVTAQRKAKPPRAIRPRFLVVAGGLCLILLGVLIRPVDSGTGPAPSRETGVSGEEQSAPVLPHPRASVGPSHVGTPRARGNQKVGVHATRRSGRASAKSDAGPDRSKAPRKGPSAQPSPAGARASTDNRVATRLFVWLPSRRARYYNVQFLKQGRTVFEAWPKNPRVTVPIRGTLRGRRFAFTAGRYRWIVRPAFGTRSRPRYGEPIVRSIWVVRA